VNCLRKLCCYRGVSRRKLLSGCVATGRLPPGQRSLPPLAPAALSDLIVRGRQSLTLTGAYVVFYRMSMPRSARFFRPERLAQMVSMPDSGMMSGSSMVFLMPRTRLALGTRPKWDAHDFMHQ